MGTKHDVDPLEQRDAVCEAAAAALADRGWFVAKSFVPPELVAALAAEARSLRERGAFRPAGVGRGSDLRVAPDVRGDSLHWLDPHEPTGPQRELLARLEQLRQHLNRSLYLGLHEIELQYAIYPPGGHYERHVDQHHGARARVVTVLLYLNAGWRVDDGGALRIYPNADALEPIADVLPEAGTFVCFLSDEIPHEVLPPQRERLSLGGWFRTR